MKKFILLFALVALVAAGCKKETEEGTKEYVEFIAGNIGETEGSESGWNIGDKIGIFAYSEDGTPLLNNAEYEVISTDGKMVLVESEEKEAILPPKVGTNYYYAYYPYDASLSGTKVEINLSENMHSVFWARVEGNEQQTITLPFVHKSIKLNFNLSFADGGPDSFNGANIKYWNLLLNGSYSIFSGRWEYNSGAYLSTEYDIQTEENSISQTIYALKDNGVHNFSITVNLNNKTYKWKPSSNAPDWEEGEEYSYEIILSDKIAAEVGDFYYSDGTWSTSRDMNKKVIGVIYHVESGGQSGKVFSWEIPQKGFDDNQSQGQARWSTEKVEILGARDQNNGLANMRAVWEQSKDYSPNNSFARYPAFAWVHQLNISSGIDPNGYEDNSKGVWYLPSINELSYIYDVKFFFERSLENGILSNYGYCSSTEKDATNVHMFILDFGQSQITEKDWGHVCVRAILNF